MSIYIYLNLNTNWSIVCYLNYYDEKSIIVLDYFYSNKNKNIKQTQNQTKNHYYFWKNHMMQIKAVYE